MPKTEALKILVVEDNLGDYVLVDEFLLDELKNTKVSQASRFSEASEVMKSREIDFDAILLDLSLPDKNGEELVDAMLEIADDIPVIVLTGYTDLSFSMKSLAKGISDYLLKDELTPVLLKKSILYSIERNEHAANVRRSEKNYRNLFELSPLPMWLYDIETLRFLDVNEAAIQHYGYSKEEFMKMTIREIRPDWAQEQLDKSLEQTRKNPGLKYIGVNTHRKKNGELMKIEIQNSSIEYNGRDARLILAVDITEKLKEEERLKLLESVVTHAKEFMVILEAEPFKEQDRRIVFVNKAFTEITGYEKEEVIGESLYLLNGEKTDMKEVEKLRKAMENWETSSIEFINYTKDGKPFWVNTSIVPVADKKGGFSHWVVIGREINERKRYEKELQESLKEKDILLSEIHHRVKNNLAVISGMIQLQAFEEEDRAVEDKLQDSITRIHTMATIHELLYQSGSFSRLQFTDIVNQLIDKTEGVFENDCDIKVTIEKASIQLNINQAIPTSLMINEVITNSYKHAFKGLGEGHISVSIKEKGQTVMIRIEDNGIGLPDDADQKESLGLHIIDILATQLHGDKKLYNSGNGTVFELKFQKSDVSGAGSNLMD